MDNIATLFLCLFGSAFFSGAEIALLGLGPLNLVRGNRDRLLKLYRVKTKLIATLLIGNNLTIVGGALALHNFLGEHAQTSEKVLAFFIEILLFFILAEVIPKTIFQKKNLIFLESMYLLIWFFHYLFKPISFLFIVFSNFLNRLVPDHQVLKHDDIFTFLETEMGPKGHGVTDGLLKLSITKVKEIMTPLSDMYSLEKNARVKDGMLLLQDTGYSRYPIYESRGDQIVGYVNVRDFLKIGTNSTLNSILIEPTYIPETLPVDQLLYQMQQEKLELVFIISEYGSILGMVTLEDMAEVLVGDILSEEQKQEKEYIIPKKNGQYLLNTGVDIDDFNEYFHCTIKKDGFETLTGFLLQLQRKVPEKNDIINTDYGNFIIKEADKKTIHNVVYSRD